MFAQLWPFIPVNKEGPGLVPLQKKSTPIPYSYLLFSKFNYFRSVNGSLGTNLFAKTKHILKPKV